VWPRYETCQAGAQEQIRQTRPSNGNKMENHTTSCLATESCAAGVVTCVCLLPLLTVKINFKLDLKVDVLHLGAEDRSVIANCIYIVVVSFFNVMYFYG